MLDDYHLNLNGIHTNIPFTMEAETDGLGIDIYRRLDVP
jgi:hypothetical protein